MDHLIELRKVSKYYVTKDTVSAGFSRIDLTLDMGEFVVITGESGSGKSTLLNVISGLDTYEEGEMFVAGQDTGAFRTEDYENFRKTYIGNIFQDFNLVNSYTVYQNIELAMIIGGKKRGECKDRINALIDQVDLKKYKRTRVSRLSGGQKQRVAIARAFAKNSPIIVADEPTGNLDSESALKVMEMLYRMSENRLVIIVTHNYEQAEPYATRKITMQDGKIIEDKRMTPSVSRRRLEPIVIPQAVPEAASDRSAAPAQETAVPSVEPSAAPEVSSGSNQTRTAAPIEKEGLTGEEAPAGTAAPEADETLSGTETQTGPRESNETGAPAPAESASDDLSACAAPPNGAEAPKTQDDVEKRAADELESLQREIQAKIRASAEEMNRQVEIWGEEPDGRDAAEFASVWNGLDADAGTGNVQTAGGAGRPEDAAGEDRAASSDGFYKKQEPKPAQDDAEEERPAGALTGAGPAGSAAATDDGNVHAADTLFDSEDFKAEKSTGMRFGSQVRLGVRNTVNIPIKFILLLLIYLFICVAVTAQYTSTMASLHQAELQGMNMYFTNTDPTRIVLQKTDKSAFTDEDYAAIGKIDHVQQVVKDDLSLDQYIDASSDTLYIQGPVYSTSGLKADQLAFGALPANDQEIVIGVNSLSSNYDQFASDPESVLGQTVELSEVSNSSANISLGKATIVGIVKEKTPETSADMSYDKIYVSDAISGKIRQTSAAQFSTLTFVYGKGTTPGSLDSLYRNAKVPAGQAYVTEDIAANYDKSNAKGKTFQIQVKNLYYSTSADLKITQIVTDSNVQKLLGISKQQFAENYSSGIFVNDADITPLFNKGDFQISVLADKEENVDDLAAALKQAGYKTLVIKDTLSNPGADVYLVINRILNIAVLVIIFIVLFFISYTVIRLIMRSRNPYYSTLRILGATRKNISRVLRTELLFVMLIAIILTGVLLYLIMKGTIAVDRIRANLIYMKPRDYVILVAALLGMSLLISGRYARKIFGKSAMNVYREEV